MIKPSETHIDEHHIFEQKLISAFGLDDYKYIFATQLQWMFQRTLTFKESSTFITGSEEMLNGEMSITGYLRSRSMMRIAALQIF